MSHAVRIDYEGMSIQCISICDQALKQLCKINKMLEWTEQNAKSLINSKIKDYENYLLKSKEDIESRLESLKIVAKEVASRKQLNQNNIVTEAIQLGNLVQDLTTTKLLLIEDMINDEIKQNAIRQQERFVNQTKGVIEISNEMVQQLSQIEDIALRETVYQEAIKYENQGMNFEELIELGKKSLNKRTEEVLTNNLDKMKIEIQEELKEAKIDSNTIEQVMTTKGESIQETIENMRKLATKEIVDETVRKETIKIIIKTIEKRNFIVDKKNIKLNKDKNEVYVIAQKASGEKAEFKIYLDGKFIYKFDGYEGQACQKDIEPFMEDLEEIYGIKVTNREEIWRNPDKISSMKYQTINQNKGKN